MLYGKHTRRWTAVPDPMEYRLKEDETPRREKSVEIASGRFPS